MRTADARGESAELADASTASGAPEAADGPDGPDAPDASGAADTAGARRAPAAAASFRAPDGRDAPTGRTPADASEPSRASPASRDAPEAGAPSRHRSPSASSCAGASVAPNASIRIDAGRVSSCATSRASRASRAGHVADQHGVRACVRVDDRQRCGEFAHARHRARRGAVLLEPAAQSRREPGQHRIVAVAIAAHDAIGRRACAQPERARLGPHARLRGLVERARGGKHERDIARRAGDARDPRRVVIAGPPARVDDPLPRERRAQLGERRVIEPHRRVLESVGRDELQHRAVVVRHEPAGAREPLDEAPRRQRLAHVEPARRARVDVDGDARAAAQLAQCIGGVHRADAIVETRERPRERHRPQRRRMARERERDGGSRCGRAPRHDARSAVSASAPRFRR